MADDCICTNLLAIHDVLNDILLALQNLYQPTVYIGQSVHSLDNRFRIIDSDGTWNIVYYVKGIRDSLDNINSKLTYDNKSIAEIWSFKEMCVSNETIVESPLSTFVSKAKLDIDE